MNNDYHNTTEYEWNEDAVQHADNTEGAAENAPSKVSKQKNRERKKRKKKHYLLKIFVLILICIGLYFFLHSSLFNIKTIAVDNSSHFTAAQVEKMAGLKKGMNLFDAAMGSYEKRLMENPYVEDAKVKRKLPSGVKISLTERQETAVIQMDKKFILLDNNGIVLETADKEPQLTMLAGFTVKDAKEGETAAVKEQKLFDKALEILRVMEKSDLYFKKIDISKTTVRAYVTDQLVCIGTPKNLITGMEEGNLRAVLYDLNEKKIKKGKVTIGDEQYYSFSKKGK